MGIYVDDVMTAGLSLAVEVLMETITKKWKTGGIEWLSPQTPLLFLGVTLRQLEGGFFLEQHGFLREVLKRFTESYGTRKRTTPGEKITYSPVKVEERDGEWEQRVRFQQSILGSLLWLATRTRPDVSFVVALASSMVATDVDSTA
eukprot:6480478-Amphidinium_carterae.1